jgi:hypothetical protein
MLPGAAARAPAMRIVKGVTKLFPKRTLQRPGRIRDQHKLPREWRLIWGSYPGQINRTGRAAPERRSKLTRPGASASQ